MPRNSPLQDIQQAIGAACAYAYRGLIEAAEECGLYWPFEDVCYVSARPTHVALAARRYPIRSP